MLRQNKAHLLKRLGGSLLLMLVSIFCVAADVALPQTVIKPPAADKVTTLNIGILYSAKGHRGFNLELAAIFERAHPNIKIRFNGLLDADYKAAAERWLLGEDDIDVMYWQAGERLFHYTRRGLVHPLNNATPQGSFNDIFPESILDVVSEQGNTYALPFAYYTWGMFYNDKVLAQLNLDAPRTWKGLLTMCKVARENGIVPIMLASKDPWLPAAWFDYINLRLNGQAFHQQLLKGNISFLDDRVKNVFEHWATLIKADCFISTHQHLTWRGLLPPLLRKMAVSTLVANFVDIDIPQQFVPELSFHRFPVIDESVPLYEDVPVDVFLIPSASKKKNAAEQFIHFLAQPDIQWLISDAIGQSSPHHDSPASSGHFARQNNKILVGTQAVAQYYDRDMAQPMVEESLSIIARFLVTADVKITMQALEKLRKEKQRSTQG